jgi:anti-sigma B factor antagonist
MSFSDAPDPDDPLAAREQEVMAGIAEGETDQPLSVRLSQRDGVPVIQLRGELDMYTAGLFRARMEEALAGRPPALVVDLSGAAYVDSSGLAILLRAAGQLPGRLHVVSPKERVTRLFQATGLSGRMKLHRSLAEAMLHVAMG